MNFSSYRSSLLDTTLRCFEHLKQRQDRVMEDLAIITLYSSVLEAAREHEAALDIYAGLIRVHGSHQGIGAIIFRSLR
ncbi:unnamed protein product [Chrysoparadoxa australica]